METKSWCFQEDQGDDALLEDSDNESNVGDMGFLVCIGASPAPLLLVLASVSLAGVMLFSNTVSAKGKGAIDTPSLRAVQYQTVALPAWTEGYQGTSGSSEAYGASEWPVPSEDTSAVAAREAEAAAHTHRESLVARAQADTCPWRTPHHGEYSTALCEDGTYVSDWACAANGHGQRVKCPRDKPFMCADKHCGLGQDHCCHSSVDSCLIGYGGLRPCQESPTPDDDLHDGNLCAENEELYGGLCYKKCSLLTKGLSPLRTSSWTCCEDPCNLVVEHSNVGKELLCSGYDVNGAGGCPHAPGVCLENEELHVGICYKKCSILTDGQYVHRTGAATCCRAEGFGCFDLMNDWTRVEFNVGGGAKDGDPATPDEPHTPEAEQETTDVHEATKLNPEENRHDGNVCDDQEELHAGLCYKKCSLLTDGEAPVRTSSWTCCTGHPCGLSNQRGSTGTSFMCGGFDVNAEGSCPHPPGVCLTDEEFSLGTCYEKCSLLTNGEFPYRYSGVTCCKTEGAGCINPMNLRTRPSFAVGGGAGDQNAGTPNLPHAPYQSLSEEGKDPSDPPGDVLVAS